MTDSFLESLKGLEPHEKVKELITFGVLDEKDILKYEEYKAIQYEERDYDENFIKSLTKVDLDLKVKESSDLFNEMDVYVSNTSVGNSYYAIKKGINPEREPKNLIPIDSYGNYDFVSWGIKFIPNFIYNHECHVTRCSKCIITRNNIDFMEVDRLKYGTGLNSLLSGACTIINRLNEHPLELNRQEFDKKIVDTPIWFYQQKAKIVRFVWGRGSVIIAPVDTEYFTYFDFNDTNEIKNYEEREIQVSLLDERVNWIRM